MLQYNTMRFGTDEFVFDRQGLLTSKVALDTTGQTSVGAFTITGSEPNGTKRRFLFKVDNKIWKFVEGAPVEYTGGTDVDSVLANGNTAAEVTAVADNSAWVNKKIYPIIALYADVDATVMPTAKISLAAMSSSATFEYSVETAEYELKEASQATPRIVSVDVTSETTGSAMVYTTARVKNGDTWSDYTSLAAISGKEAEAIQFKTRFTVTTLDGTDSGKLTKIVIRYTMGEAVVSGDNAEIFSVIQDYELPLGTCSVTIRHDRLTDSVIKAYVNLMKPSKSRVFLPIGVATGTADTFVLGENGVGDTNIDQNTLKVFGNGAPVANFSYNTETSELTVTADAGTAITASYTYDRDQEFWREMSKDVNQQPYNDGTVLTRFSYSLPEEEQFGQTVSNIRLQLYRTQGTVTNAILGTANGMTQQFVLKHAAKADTIICNAAWSYNENSQILTCVAPKDTEITISYDWIGESHTVHSWAAGWSPVL
ncbi:MAG: hypothetical protein IJ774_05730 [Selenomonadaceae bacterium]|nr:hypothetical protein [Selenomonadaceae bacterium]MBR1805875.1 hypothetical protein [Selenomonadaceae bacterium]